MLRARQAIAALEQAVDTLIVVNNDQLLKIIPEDTPVENAFKVADDVLRQVTRRWQMGFIWWVHLVHQSQSLALERTGQNREADGR